MKITGAGIGGLFLAILLDKAGIPYEIYERAAVVKPLGKDSNHNNNSRNMMRNRWDNLRSGRLNIIIQPLNQPYLGSVMSLSPNILAAIEQVGLLEELRGVSFNAGSAKIMYDDMKVAAELGNFNDNGQ